MICQSRIDSHAQLCTRQDTVHATIQHRPIEHVRQHYSWDCGVACALMLLRSFGMNDVCLPDLHAQCASKRWESTPILTMPSSSNLYLCTKRLCLNKFKICSIWTVDLAHLLASYGCNVSFFTVTVGANPDFAAERFYARNMAVDRGRVDRLFNAAASAGISIKQCSVPWQDLRDIVIAGM